MEQTKQANGFVGFLIGLFCGSFFLQWIIAAIAFGSGLFIGLTITALRAIF